jgi:glutamate-1-semialdehyde-2,1-aminomutase
MIKYQDLPGTFSAKLPGSNALLERADKVLVSFVTTGPYRAPANVAFVKRAEGSRVWDIDGNEYLDVTMGYGPLILGHAHPIVVEAAQRAVADGTTYAIAHEHEVHMAELMVDAIPCADKVLFCNSGTEATMYAIRIARATSGKDKVATFEMGWHGPHDYGLIGSMLSEGKGPANAPLPSTDCKGVPERVVDESIKLAFNSEESLQHIRELKDEIAVVIIEAMPSGYPLQMQSFLEKLRAVTSECGVLLMFDEVITGFRCAYGGAQEKFGVVPDLAAFGKAMGGGMPVGAVVGTDQAMSSIVSSGDPVQDAMERKVVAIGTFSGNPVTMRVGAAVVEHLRDNPSIYRDMDALTAQVKTELNAFAKDREIPFELLGDNSWFMPYMGDKPFQHARDCHDENHVMRNIMLCNYLRYMGVYFPDMHTGFFSAAHNQADAEFFVDTCKTALLDLRAQNLL